MDTTSTITSSSLDGNPRRRSMLRLAAVGALVATLVNVTLWAGGRAADVGFVVSTPLDPAMHVGAVLVVLTTLVMFALGAGVLALAARRSRRSVRVVTTVAAAFAVVSAAGPLAEAHDAATGALLATMHLVTGAAFVATAARVRIR